MVEEENPNIILSDEDGMVEAVANAEKTTDAERAQKEWISHLVTNRLIPVLLITEMGNSAEENKRNLITELRSRAAGSLIEEVVMLIEASDWSNAEGIKRFKANYSIFAGKHNL